MRLIDADELREFFFSETSGTEEIINDLMMKHNLDYSHDVNEDDVVDFAKDLLLAVRNVIDTEPTAEHDKQIRAEVIEPIQKFIDDYDGAIIISENMGVISGQQLINELKEIVEQLKGAE